MLQVLIPQIVEGFPEGVAVSVLLNYAPSDWAERLSLSRSIEVLTTNTNDSEMIFAAIRSHFGRNEIQVATNILGGGAAPGKLVIKVAQEFGAVSVLRIAGNELNAVAAMRPDFLPGNDAFEARKRDIERNNAGANLLWVMNVDEADRVVSEGVNADAVRIAPRGVDLEVFRAGNPPTADELRLLYVGRDSAEKGPDVAFSAMQHLQKLLPSTQAAAVGQFETLPAGIYDLGRCAPRSVHQHMLSANLVLVPSRSDAMPQVVLESMASNRLCILSEGVADRTFPAGTALRARADTGSVVRRCLDYLQDPGSFAANAEASLELVRTQYSREVCLPKQRDLFNEALAI